MDTKQIRVAWICSFSNARMRARLPIRTSLGFRLISRLSGSPISQGTDMAIWNSNAIDEFETIENVDLHIICPVRGLVRSEVRYTENGIHYYFFREQNSNVFRFVIHHLFSKYTSKYKKNRRTIRKLIKGIQPDIVHVMGAENPFYSMALLDVPSNIPTIIQLQALLTRLVGVTTVNEEKKSFYYKGLIEREIIKKADYIGTLVKDFREYIKEEIKPDARFLDITLAMAQKVKLETTEKQFDFVYFSSNIAKAGEEAVESFILASKVCPKITLDIIGGYEDTFKAKLDTRIKECGLSDCVVFEGRLPSHNDVITQIKKAKYALLPLKMDFVPNTIHEAMANGLPVVTTITEGTPSLNQPCQRVLLSPQRDFQAMANNMIALLEDRVLENELREAAATYEGERTNNRAIVLNWCKAYQEIVELCR